MVSSEINPELLMKFDKERSATLRSQFNKYIISKIYSKESQDSLVDPCYNPS